MLFFNSAEGCVAMDGDNSVAIYRPHVFIS